MKNSHAKTVYTMLALMVLLLTVFVSTFSVPVSALEDVRGAIWTTNATGSQVNGNFFSDPRDVYLQGGPQKPGGLGLADGRYLFQVTDTSGKTLLSSDVPEKRVFSVSAGRINEVPFHKYKTLSDGRKIIQLWPFDYTPKTVGEYKVWVTTEDRYLENNGFVESYSKTDNFKTGRSSKELLKYFELKVTTGISALATTLDWDFSVSYAVETLGVLGPWTSGPLLWDRTENGLEVYRYDTTFANGAIIYWQFSLTGDVNWDSVVKGPETISENGMVNSEICPLFVVSGHKYEGTPTPNNYVPSSNSRINLSDVSSDVQLGSTLTDSTGYYQFVAEASEIGTDFNVSTSGSTVGSELWHDFTANLPPADRTFDFYDYDIANLQGLNSPTDVELYPNFAVVFSPSNDGTEPTYKLSSTNPGAFHFDVEVFRETIGKGAGGAPLVEMNILLPEAHEVWDTPNFFVKHSTPNNGVDPIWDIHIYAKTGDTITADITDDFIRTVTPDVKGIDGKNVTVTGVIPLGATSVVVSLHLDYQISGSLTQVQVVALQNFQYEFTMIIGDPFGVRGLFGVR